MDYGMTGLIISLAVAAMIAGPLGGALKKHPSAFYLAALAVTAVYVWGVYSNVSLAPVRFLTVIFQKGYLGSVLLALVMFTGCLDRKGALRAHLQPLRGPLSILSSIFFLGHLATYIPLYVPVLGMVFSLKANVAASLVVAVILTLVFATLTVTSFMTVRTKMSPRAWKALQRLAYVMVALIVVHVGLVLSKSALVGGASRASMTLAIYVAVVVLYAVLRVRRELVDRRAQVVAAGEGAPA